MPNVRSKDQTLIAFPLDRELLEKLDRARDGKSRSQFLREAIRDKLTGMGFTISENKILPPDRAGKGGRIAGLALVAETPDKPSAPAPLTLGKRVRYKAGRRLKKGKSPRVIAGPSAKEIAAKKTE